MSNWGIKERVLFVALMPATVIAVVLAGYFLVLRYADIEESMFSRGQALVRQMAPAAEYGALSGNREELRHLAESLLRAPDISAVVIFDAGGARLAQAGRARFDGNPNVLPDGWSGRSEDGETVFFHAKIQPRFDAAGNPWPPATRESRPAGAAPGSVMLEISRAGIIGHKREMLAVTAIFTALVLGAGGLLALRLGRDVLEPIVNLQNAVAAIRGGRLDTRVSLHPAGTLRSLEEGVNEMAASLQAGHDRLEQRVAAATAELTEKKEEAEQSNLAKSRFLASASHDLRQPLHALSLFAAELEHQARGTSQEHLSSQISAAVGVIGELLDALLDISRLDVAGSRALHEATALEPILQRVLAAYAASARAKGLRLSHVATSLWADSDARLLERMLGNLVANAIRYTERGGVVLGARRDGQDVRIEVWDSGIGIAPENQHLVFQEFFQIGNPERDPAKGLGLGLAIVERMAHRLEHRLLLRSRPGAGSVFTIVAPRAEPVQAPVAAAAVQIGQFSARALLISPSGPAADSLRGLLDSWGLETDSLDTLGDEERALLMPPDVILFDESRIAAAAVLIEEACMHGPQPAAILLGEAPPDMQQVFGERAYACLAKPIRPAKLRALLQHLLESRLGENVTL